MSAGRGQIFVANSNSNSIGEYHLDGTTVNTSLITGLSNPFDVVVAGSNLFVLNGNGTIGEYTTSESTVNATLITGLTNAQPLFF